jgi:hypothetical protein
MAPGTRPHALAAILVALVVPQSARAQAPSGVDDPEPDSPCIASALTSRTHWLRGAVRRLDLAGPHELGSAATGTLPLGEAVRALEAVARDGDTPAAREAAAAYLERLAVEHPGLDRGMGPCGGWLDTRVEAGLAASRGLFRPGFGYDPDFDWTGARAVDPVTSPAVGAAVIGGWDRVGARLDMAARGDGVEIEDAHVAADLGDVVVWAGRRGLHYGPGQTGGLVLGGDARVTGVGAVVTDPIRLPWVLGMLGPIGMESFFSRARGGEIIVDPWFWGARLTASPHSRFRIGASRGTMFGGDGNTPVTLRHALQMLLGMHSGEAGEFDNHFGSIDLRYRTPGTPLDLHIEWAMHDGAGAWWDSPARLLGVQWSALPFAPGIGLGAELVHIPRSCCGNPIWYRNWAFRMGWTSDGDLVAHPLGGHGRELSVRLDGVMAGGIAVGHMRGFHRHRGDENLFHPQWGGGSAGLETVVQFQPGPGAGAMLRAYLERGSGWSAGRVFGGVTWSFGG